ncbi:5'-methylthioadenosine_nucleosidase / S-adenosylhomocysteine nucleosidase [Hexamita inflata]|uniref:adenosylhomocysteine nucleosidase n=1 Tax=Hexamita inflata TaxID=28002 RepID=A0AA86Q306_9EUKA|nr:5'-methylthioadenosine nucleosidase / S-adenosylhomocysteine nucleosidase [Hexamita inflata]
MIGLLCATDREFETLQKNCEHLEKVEVMGRTFYQGEFQKKKVVLSKCGVGKVSCALTVAAFHLQFKCTKLVFVGTAGALSKDLRVGDIVVSSGCVQHDFDGRPFVEKCLVFSVGKKVIPAAEDLVKLCQSAAEKFVSSKQISQAVLDEFTITSQKVVSGIIASGDQFVSSPEMKNAILEFTPEAMCCEMEGAAVAQACFELKMDYCVVRVVSDSGDGSAFVDYEKFCDKLAGVVCFGVLKEVVEMM